MLYTHELILPIPLNEVQRQQSPSCNSILKHLKTQYQPSFSCIQVPPQGKRKGVKSLRFFSTFLNT